MKKLPLCFLALLLFVPQLHAKSKSNSNSNSQTIRISGQYQEWGGNISKTNSMGFSSVTTRSDKRAQVSASRTFNNNGDKVSVGMQAYITPKVSGNKVRYTVNASVKRTDGSGKKANYSVTQSGNISGNTTLGKSVTVKIGKANGKSSRGRYSVQMALVIKFTR